MVSAIYALCSLTSLLCAVLLLRGHRRTGVPLLLWSALCFFGLSLNNALLFVDTRLVPTVDLSVWRSIPALAGVGFLIYGLAWRAR
jgi:hypothetical protein